MIKSCRRKGRWSPEANDEMICCGNSLAFVSFSIYADIALGEYKTSHSNFSHFSTALARVPSSQTISFSGLNSI
jgi:hypothetical protein